MPRQTIKKTPVLQKLTGPATAKYGVLPKIQLPSDNELQRSFNESVAHVLQGKGIYRRDILPVIPWESRLFEMKPAPFISWATQHFIPYKMKVDRSGEPFEVLRDMTEQIAKNVLADMSFIQRLPPIHRIFPSPVPIINEADSLVLCTPGYDPSSGTYVYDGPLEPKPPTAERPPIAHLVGSDGYYDDSLTLGEAFWFLYDLLKSFPFADWEDEFIIPDPDTPLHAYDPVTGDNRSYFRSRSLAVQIGAMLATFAANCVPREAARMGFNFNANAQRSGKSLLAQIAAAPTHGAFKTQSWREDEESLVKILDSEVLAGSPYICFDNVRGLIQSQSLEGFMTSATWTGRHLGRTEMFTAENNTVVFITGNNISAGTDMQHRTLWVNLYVEEADPQSRVINAPIIDGVWLANPENRRSILSALWAIVRHWDHAGRPLATGRTRQGFDTWGKIIGGMVEFAGFGDMLARPVLDNAGDTEAEDIATLVRKLHAINAYDHTFQEVVHQCWEHGLFAWNLHGREEYASLREGNSEVFTLRLNDQCNARMGLLLARHATDRGTIHQFRDPATQQIVRARFHHRGKGRHRRFIVTLI